MKSPVRLIAIDIDGTLLDREFKIPAANLAALRRVREQGVEVVLVTGRRHTFAMPIAEMLGFGVWLISSNGAVTRSMQGELFYRHLLPAATARKLIRRMDAFRGNAVITFDRDDQGTIVLEGLEGMSPSISRWLEKNQRYITYCKPLEDCLSSDPIQAMFCGGIARMQEAQRALQAANMDGEITILKTEYPARDLCLYDVLNYGCSKGHALERWARHRGLDREQVMAIGDNHNDIEMLEFAGVPVIMGNACDDLKQPGWQITLTNDQCGVAAAVEQVLGI
ncbi:MAG TPA: Cof-type HAD-IIB family hydrolase [Terriglobales bacterium]|nr:Cof-type HAD-IIB family hydrolase [Terriglobales bacterium]